MARNKTGYFTTPSFLGSILLICPPESHFESLRADNSEHSSDNKVPEHTTEAGPPGILLFYLLDSFPNGLAVKMQNTSKNLVLLFCPSS